jgi:hypothetical protein
MARKSIVDSDGPSTADVSANEDVEMQDQDTKMSGFKKFGVSAIWDLLAPRRDDGAREQHVQLSNKANGTVAVLPGYARLYSTFTVPLRAAPHVQTD